MRTLLSCFVASLCVLAALVGVSAQPAAQADETRERWVIVACGHLMAVPGVAPMTDATLVIKDGIIHAVSTELDPGTFVPGAAADNAIIERVDLSESWVLPGLIDCHVHITSETSREGRLRMVIDTDADKAIDATVYAQRTLEAGFTTVRDVGSMGDAAFALRDAVRSGKVLGPRILVAGRAVTPTGGHGDRTHGYKDGIFDIPGPFQGVADGVAECRKAVREQVKRGADCIKLTATGGVLSNTAAGTEQQFFEDELKAIVETAHLLGRRVSAHAHGVTGINAALRAGVDSIEHGTYLDDESIALFKETGAYLVPTITAGKAVAEYAMVPRYYPPPVVEKALRVGPVIQGAFGKAAGAGVKIAFGTDAGVFPHGQNSREFGFMVEAGMSPEDAIISATINAADLCDLSDEIGTLEVGKAADLIAVGGDPRADVAQLQTVPFVMRAGVVAKGP